MFAAPGTPKGSRGPYWKFATDSVSVFDRFWTKKGDPKKRQNRLFGSPFPSNIRVRTGRPKRSARGPQKCSPRHPRGPQSAQKLTKVTEIDPNMSEICIQKYFPIFVMHLSSKKIIQGDAKFLKIKVRNGRLGPLYFLGMPGS